MLSWLWVAAVVAMGLAKLALSPPRSRRAAPLDKWQRKGYDYVVVGGGPSGCYLAALLAEKFPDRSVCLLNIDGDPPRMWRVYMANLVGVVAPWLGPYLQYACKSHKRQFVNSTCLGGNTNINAAVGPVPDSQDVENCLGKKHVAAFEEFLSNGELDRVSRLAPKTSGLEKLSSDLNRIGIVGGRIRVFSDGFQRIHPLDFVPERVDILEARAERFLFSKRVHGGDVCVTGVTCSRGNISADILGHRRVFLCCGALESPKLLMQSGIGPSRIVSTLVGKDNIVVENEHVGSNLQDHWVGRVSAKVPEQYKYPTLYPVMLGYKHKFDGVAMGFGKLQLLGSNLLSFATTRCINPGKIILTASGTLEPYLPIGEEDFELYHASLAEVISRLRTLGIEIQPKPGPLSPNWHLSCSLGVGNVCDENFGVLGVENLSVADVSCMQRICPMNTQIVSYIIPYCLVQTLC